MKKYLQKKICAQNCKKYLKNNQDLIVKARKKIKDAQLFALLRFQSEFATQREIKVLSDTAFNPTYIYVLSYNLDLLKKRIRSLQLGI